MSWDIRQGDALERLREMPDESVLAYLAGIVDGEGSISVRRSTYAMRHDNGGGAIFSERIKVKMVDPQAVDLLHNRFGGRRCIESPAAKRGKPLHSWEATGRVAHAAIVALRPYLRVKAAQADNCFGLRVAIEASKLERVKPGRGHRGSARRSPEATLRMEACYARSRLLNAVGRG